MTDTSTPTIECKFNSVHTHVRIPLINVDRTDDNDLAEVWSFGLNHAAIRTTVTINRVTYQFEQHLEHRDRFLDIKSTAALDRNPGSGEAVTRAHREAEHALVAVPNTSWVYDRMSDPLRRTGTYEHGSRAATNKAAAHHIPAFAAWLDSPDGILLRAAAEEQRRIYLTTEGHQRVAELRAAANAIERSVSRVEAGEPIPYSEERRLVYLRLDEPGRR